MGVRVDNTFASIPASIEDGKFVVRLNKRIWQFDIPALRGYNFGTQCRQYINPRIAAYLYNDEYGVVLRYDGTGTLFLLKGLVLVKSFMYEPFDFGDTRFVQIGFLRNEHGVNVAFGMYNIGSDTIILTDGYNKSFVLSDTACEEVKRGEGVLSYNNGYFMVLYEGLHYSRKTERIRVDCEAFISGAPIL